MAILTNEGELLSAGEAFSVDPGTGTFLAPRIGPHEVTGEVDFLGNGVRNAVLESPEIRQVEGGPGLDSPSTTPRKMYSRKQTGHHTNTLFTAFRLRVGVHASRFDL